jgi:hypothetical protein
MVMPSSEGSGSKTPQGSSGSGSGAQVVATPPETRIKTTPPEPEPPRAEPVLEARLQLARDGMAQAREDLARRRYQACLNRCDMIVWWFPDLPEAREAQKLAADIKSSPEMLSQACEIAGEQLAGMLLTLADAWMKRGQPQQAVLCLERIIKMCPGTRTADLAHLRLSEIQGQPTQPAGFAP